MATAASIPIRLTRAMKRMHGFVSSTTLENLAKSPHRETFNKFKTMHVYGDVPLTVNRKNLPIYYPTTRVYVDAPISYDQLYEMFPNCREFDYIEGAGANPALGRERYYNILKTIRKTELINS
jgi:hypothetical protein